MYPVSSQYIEKINTSNISDRQISGTIKLLNGQTIQLTNDILSGGSLAIDNSCESGSDFQLGSAYIGQLSFSIFGDYSRYAFYQADNGGIINLTYTLIDNIPLGIYTIYECTKKGKNITIKAYDNMAKLKKSIRTNNTNGSILSIIDWIMLQCGTELANRNDIVRMKNSDVVVNVNGTDYSTYQDLFIECLSLMGCIAFADRTGKIKVKKLDTSPIFELTPMVRKNITPSDYDVFYTSIIETDKDNLKIVSNTGAGGGLTYNLNNKFVTGTTAVKKTIVDNILDSISAINYTPCDINTIFNPIFDLGDMIKVKQDGIILKEDINILITSYKYSYNGSSSLKSVGSNRFLTESGLSNSTSTALSSAYNNLKNQGTYISTYENASSYNVSTTATSIAYLEMETGESEKAALSGQAYINVTTAGTIKIEYALNGNKDNFYVEEYLTTGKHILNFCTWFDLTTNEQNSVNYYDIYVSSSNLKGQIPINKIKVYVLSSAVSEGLFDVNNRFEEILDTYTMHNNITPIGYDDGSNTEEVDDNEGNS